MLFDNSVVASGIAGVEATPFVNEGVGIPSLTRSASEGRERLSFFDRHPPSFSPMHPRLRFGLVSSSRLRGCIRKEVL